jgi:hypothetical protein
LLQIENILLLPGPIKEWSGHWPPTPSWKFIPEQDALQLKKLEFLVFTFVKTCCWITWIFHESWFAFLLSLTVFALNAWPTDQPLGGSSNLLVFASSTRGSSGISLINSRPRVDYTHQTGSKSHRRKMMPFRGQSRPLASIPMDRLARPQNAKFLNFSLLCFLMSLIQMVLSLRENFLNHTH